MRFRLRQLQIDLLSPGLWLAEASFENLCISSRSPIWTRPSQKLNSSRIKSLAIKILILILVEINGASHFLIPALNVIFKQFIY